MEGATMSDLELALLFREYYGVLQTQYINYISVLFAFIVAGYLVASKLRPAMVIVVVVLFSAFAVDSIIVMNFLNSDVSELQRLAQGRLADGHTDLSWFTGAKVTQGPVLHLFAVLRHITVIGGYVGALIFFFHQRHAGRMV